MCLVQDSKVCVCGGDGNGGGGQGGREPGRNEGGKSMGGGQEKRGWGYQRWWEPGKIGQNCAIFLNISQQEKYKERELTNLVKEGVETIFYFFIFFYFFLGVETRR